MTSPAAGDGSSASFQHEPWFHEACDRFEAAWKAGAEPRIEEYLGQFPMAEPIKLTALLHELVLIDLEYRWLSADWRTVIASGPNEVAARHPSPRPSPLPARPLLEDYASHYPQLGPLKDLPIKLMQQEYRVRGLHGDWPSPSEYAKRFPGRAEVVRAVHEHDPCPGKSPPQAFRLNCPLPLPTGDSSEPGGDETIEAAADSKGLRKNLLSAFSESGEPLPSQIGRYDIRRLLGKGGFGLVYLAYDDHLRRQVAIKVPHRHRLSSDADISAYLAEARLVAELQHPHIVPIYDAGRTDDGRWFVVSLYVHGSDLRRLISDERGTHRESARLVATVAEAVHYAHRRRITHRDIKPANILVDSDRKPYLTDFGLALRDEDRGREPQVAGTPAYMSPEQVRGDTHLMDGRTDVFSLGIVFYELLTRARPFGGSSRRELAQQICAVHPRPPRQLDENIPTDLEKICLKAISKNPDDRYLSAWDFAFELKHYLEPGSSTGNRPSSRTDIVVPASYFCYISHRKVDDLLLQLEVRTAGLASTATIDADICQLPRVAYGQPGTMHKDAQLKYMYSSRLHIVLRYLAHTISDFNSADVHSCGPGALFAYDGEFRVATIDNGHQIVSLVSEQSGHRLMLDCSMKYFSEQPQSANYAFFERRVPVHFHTVFLLIATSGCESYGSPLFLKLSMNAGLKL